MVAGLGLVAWEGRGRPGRSVRLLRRFDWNTTFFLVGVFVLVEALVKTGLIVRFAELFGAVTGEDPFTIYVCLVVVSVVCSAFIDNIPFITTMIPVVQELAVHAGANEIPLVFGMVIGASLGGNITPFGASANVVAVGLLRKEHGPVSTGTFLRIGLPFTLAATGAGAALLWAIWGEAPP